ncbi:AraC family transcriptional regulator [Dyella subtropica]|uniref:AraC family transcriptional regulator n=1 Tax=Dyella subtropica TaxID=2992127 RepID=UPI00224CF086|nr:GyrI-like domain-containing protein [Dyella subtropica]
MHTYSAYLARIHRVFDYIDAHLAESLDLDALAKVAHFSPYHFHRIFKAMAGETLAERVRRRRAEVAATRLVAMPDVTASRIAMDVGFASPEVFTRAFRSYFGMTPTVWRGGGYLAWSVVHREALSKIHQAESKKHQVVLDAIRKDAGMWPHGHVPATGDTPMNVEIKKFSDARVAYMRHVGPYGSASISQMWQRFGGWCREQGLIPPPRLMYGVCLDNPGMTPADKLRYDACIEVGTDFKPQGEIGVTALKGGKYACASFAGTAAEIAGAWGRFVSDWLPASGYVIDTSDEARCAMELYGKDFKMDKDTGVFNCELCLPVRHAV